MTNEMIEKLRELLLNGKLFDAVSLYLGNKALTNNRLHNYLHLVCTHVNLDVKDIYYYVDLNFYRDNKGVRKYSNKLISKLHYYWKKSNIQVIRNNSCVDIPKNSKLGLLYNLYEGDFNKIVDIYREKYNV